MKNSLPDNLEFILTKRYQFVVELIDFVDTYTRNFTFLKVRDGELYIGHRVEDKFGKETRIEYNDLQEWVNYFDRI